MNQKGYISETINGGRIVAHGQIKNLSQPFSLPGNTPFSVYVRPKAETAKLDTILNVRCWQDKTFSDAPVALYDWSPLAIEAVGADSSLLEHFDVYWGSGTAVEV